MPLATRPSMRRTIASRAEQAFVNCFEVRHDPAQVLDMLGRELGERDLLQTRNEVRVDSARSCESSPTPSTALRNELQAQRAAHRDPFGVLAAVLRELRPSAVRVGHAVWQPKSVDAYLRATWRLSDPEIRAIKGVWRDAKLIAVERDTFARKFTVQPGTVAYMFAVPTRVFDLFRVDPPAADDWPSAGESGG